MKRISKRKKRRTKRSRRLRKRKVKRRRRRGRKRKRKRRRKAKRMGVEQYLKTAIICMSVTVRISIHKAEIKKFTDSINVINES